MEESKIVATERLRREGRWEEASKLKDAALREFKAKGMKRAEASEAAWNAMLEAFPPLVPADTPTEPPPGAASESTHRAGGARCVSDGASGSPPIPDNWGEIPDSANFEAEVEWVHQNRVLVVEERPGGSARLHWNRARNPAPSYGAINLMEFAATNRAKFMDVVLRVKPGSEEQEEEANSDDPSLEEVERMLAEMIRQWEQDLAKDVPGTVQVKVRGVVSDWKRRYGSELAADAVESLGLQMTGVVGDCIRAVLKHPERFKQGGRGGCEGPTAGRG